MRQKKFVIGDIHGRYNALKEVLKKAKINYDKDKLIILGDIVDGGYNSYKVVEELLKIKNKILIMGNHDEWFVNHIKTGWAEEIWLQQGGCNTLESYGAKVKEANYITEESFVDTRKINIPITHQAFFNDAIYWYIEDDMMFVHGGFNPKLPMEKQDKHTLVWDRSLIEKFRNGRKTKYDKIFVGHTTTQTYGNDLKIKDCLAPIQFGKLIMMDTGAGWNGKLTIMNIKTEKYWQSKIQNPAR